MTALTIHLINSDGKTFCGKTKGYGSEKISAVRKSLQPCQSCLNIYEKQKKKNQF